MIKRSNSRNLFVPSFKDKLSPPRWQRYEEIVLASLRETFYPALFLRLVIRLFGFVHPLSPPYPIPLPPPLPLILSHALCISSFSQLGA